MEYVMVPVPSELVAEVQQFLQWNTGKLPPDFWGRAEIVEFLNGLDAKALKLVLHAGVAADEVVVLSIHDAAEAAGCSDREVLGLMVELNDAVRAQGGPPFFLATALRHGATGGGPQAWTLNMPGAVAEVVLAAARELELLETH